MLISPGVKFVARPIVGFAFLLASGHLVLTVANISIGPRLLVLAVVVGIPTSVALRIWTTLIIAHMRAASMGARLMPTVKGRWPGNLDILADLRRNWNVSYPLEVFRDILPQSSSINLRIGWDDYVFTVEPEHIKIILATDFNNYVKGLLSLLSWSPIAHSVANARDMWKFHRAATRPFFSRDRISDFDIFDHHADRAIDLMKQRMRAGYAVDFQDLASRFTMDSATEFLFGTCVNSLSAALPYPTNALSPRTRRAHTATRYGWIWPLFELRRDATAAPMEVVSAYLDPIIREAVEKRRVASSLTEAGAKEGVTLLDELLNLTSDPKVLKDEMLNILLAGRDTTMSVLTFVLYFLSVYPSVCMRLRAEILAHVGPNRRPTYDDIRDMKYLRAVINETMRLYLRPSNLRQSVNATTWPSTDPTQKPMYIPAGTKVSYSVFLMHRRADLWGPTAEEFDPDRFLDARLKTYLLSNPFQFLPFNGGPRVCLGQQFAYNEVSFMLIRLLQTFSSSTLDMDALPPGARPPPEWKDGPGRMSVEQFRPRIHLVTGGLWVKMREAD
ncbi:cytochrome P450 [Mycena sp. CBHHK59/15]|nr:cytochrome P450 [Mycena sp. CBHHK59/15]